MALACNPDLVIADEPTTALDVTIQAQILELMKKLKEELKTSIILITHDLGVVADLADKIFVMYAGNIMEEGTVEDIFYRSKHPYTKGLLNSVPNPDENIKKKLVPIDGQQPDLLNLPKGCPFSPRCKYAMKICLKQKPETTCINGEHKVSCWLVQKEREGR
ncbi:MAG: ABC transporter ATP-binding protein, partial [Clostridiaceae bacterium]